MKEIKIVNSFTNKVIICGKYESIKDCLEKNRGANLLGAYLSGAYLSGVNLSDANLRGAYLSGAENYSENHDFFQEIIRRQKLDYFTNPQWSIIGQIIIHRLCWDSIKKRYNKKAMTIFKKLSKVGFNEWEERYKEML
jgi:hypothetical protein